MVAVTVMVEEEEVAAAVLVLVLMLMLVLVVRVRLWQDVETEGRYVAEENRRCGTLKYGSCLYT